MLVEEFKIDNVRCFENLALRFMRGNTPCRWVTFLSENGGGKSTVLQALGLLLAGPEGAQQLLPRPFGWLRNEDQPGKITVRIRQGPKDPGRFGETKVSRAFGYTFFLTGSKRLTIRNKVFTEPSIQESAEKRLTWLRQNALTSKGKGWFAVGYGAFRRLTRSSQIIVPALEPQARIERYDELTRKDGRRTGPENEEHQLLFEFMKTARPIGGPPPPNSLEAKIDAYLDKHLESL
jgi:hypothetical protein